MALKVCMISGSYPPMKDGVGDYTAQLYNALRESLSDDISLITTETDISRDAHERGIWGIVRKWNCRALGTIIKTLMTIRPDVVHIQYPAKGYGKRPEINFLPLILQLTFPRVQVISTIHEFTNRSLLGKLRLLISIIFSDKVIIVDKQYARDIKRFWPFAGCKLVDIPVGANIMPPSYLSSTEVKHLRESRGIAMVGFLICFFGVVKAGKGIELLLEAFRLVHGQYPHTKVLFIGRIDEAYFDRSIKPLINEHEFSSSILVTGSCPSEAISQYFAISDICVLPFEDGVSTKRGSFMAALQHGLPIITTRGRFVPEGLMDRENVMLVDYGSSDGLANAIVELIENDELRIGLAWKALELAREFRWDNIALRTLGLYRSVSNSSQS
jgi:glycosyltransferase involved in cell wall biosynthesis